MAGRNKKGKFVLKSETERHVRSIRTTDWVWDEFGFLADSRRITRADLLEEWVRGQPPAAATSDDTHTELVDVVIAVDILRDALHLKANAGGAIKEQIRAALDELKGEPFLPHPPPD
jgi:hypothetical protein